MDEVVLVLDTADVTDQMMDAVKAVLQGLTELEK